jgi:uncharacterized membrane protein YqjE
LATLSGEFRRMAQLRWELAELELRGDLARLKRLVVAWGVAAVLALAVMPVLAVWLAAILEQQFQVSPLVSLPVLAGGLLIVAGGVAWGSWSRFRAKLSGLEETLEELREDMVWLEEWAGQKDADGNQDFRTTAEPAAKTAAEGQAKPEK